MENKVVSFVNQGEKCKELRAVPIHVELDLGLTSLSDHDAQILKLYGGSRSGRSISRDLLIPSDMPLHYLHYALARAFGFQNEHLHHFILPKEDYMRLTGGMVKNWAALVGTVFRAPDVSEDYHSWDDDYEDGENFEIWRRRKYTGPYRCADPDERYRLCRSEMREMKERFSSLEVIPRYVWYSNEKKNKDLEKLCAENEVSVVNRTFDELTLEELNYSVVIEEGMESLLERLLLSEILVPYKIYLESVGRLSRGGAKALTRELIYEYDYGDNWIFHITRLEDLTDLGQHCQVPAPVVEAAAETVIAEHRPVCVAKDGMQLVEDVGGIHGYIEFLQKIYEGKSRKEREELRQWAESLGWTDLEISCERLL
ncbi:MAG TPA: hypothetical protein PLN48_17375 [Lachnospiraceae bacterium]|nr:hypothetical protein [Lachnospiraceae bacterium]